MKIGIKTGLKSNWHDDLSRIKPDFCEIWFQADKADKYEQLLSFLQQQQIPAGLHFWGALTDGTLANLAYPDKQILQYSRQLIKTAIDIGVKYQVLYINLHPHGRKLVQVNFDKEEFMVKTALADKNICFNNLAESLTSITAYAQKFHLPVFVESVPKLSLSLPWSKKESRFIPINIGDMAIAEFESLLDIPNLYFANDFGHTCCNIITNDKRLVKKLLFEVSQKLLVKTKLLHISYIIPPFNGTDYHGSLLNPEFKTDLAVPNISDMKRLLKLYTARDDVYALVEPETDHIGNFHMLKTLITEIS